MHCIIFEGTFEEKREGRDGLNLCGGPGLDNLAAGDVLWIVTRMGDDRASPALCGRLVVDQVTRHGPDEGNVENRSHCLVVHARQSERCVPFVCDAIISWDIWRRKFTGVGLLSEEQGRTLDSEWRRATRDARKDGGG